MKKILLFALLVIIGCAPARVKLYTEKTFPPTEPEMVQIFNEIPARRNFIEIAEITVEEVGSLKEAERIFKIKGAQLGADAVYISKTSEETRSFVRPHDCEFRFGYGYPYGYHHRYHHMRNYHYGYYRHYGQRYPHRYYYCHGVPRTEEVTFMTVTGIAIKYK